MSSAHHRNLGKLIGEIGKLGFQLSQSRDNDILEGVMQHKSISEIVDILTCAREVKILFLG